MVGEERTNFILAKCVTFLVASSNDIANTYFLTGIRRLHYDVPSYTDFLVKAASGFAKVTIFAYSSLSYLRGDNLVIPVKHSRWSKRFRWFQPSLMGSALSIGQHHPQHKDWG
jgi:hypothetical protein